MEIFQAVEKIKDDINQIHNKIADGKQIEWLLNDFLPGEKKLWSTKVEIPKWALSTI